MPIIRTVCGDIQPEDLGVTYLHEHLIAVPPDDTTDPDLKLDSEAAAIKELHHFRTAGGQALVEMSTPEYGRSPEGMRRISEASDVHIIATTGYIKGGFADAILEPLSINAIADQMIADVCDGMNGTGICAGIIKAGSSKNRITPNEEKLFRAAARAHRETGAPVSTHTEAGTMALEQVALLTSEGVMPERILIGHLDRNMDWDYHIRLANTGVYFGYDQFGKEKYYPDHVRVDFVARMIAAGHLNQLALSGDLARRSYFTSYGGGPGFTFLLWRIIPWLRESGVSDDAIHTLFVGTPARFLQFNG